MRVASTQQMLLSRFGFVFIGRFSLSDWENKSGFADAASTKHGDTRRMRSTVCFPLESVCKLRITNPVSGPVTDSAVAGEKHPLRNFSWFACRCLRKYIHFRSLAHKRGWDTINYTVYWRLAWPKKCIISVKCVTSTMLGDTQRMLGLLGAAPGVVTYFRRKTARCVSRNSPKSDRCHLEDESPNLSGIGLRCVLCNRPQ